MSEINNIKPGNLPNTSNPSRTGVAGEKSSGGTVDARAVSSDTFSLTDTASQLQSLQKTIAAMPETNQQRIAALREAIDNGDYQVDTEKLAQNMIDFERQF
ncbi:flagellar biosynthesis anti-sigma factor FlgM [Methylophaga frappieri]|uniref:Negative regulator of flagellin synthesis n=1 Tax=Methylophaga frappieri (strain ATCC BAA-2434 / DSM 25690 / JAM7) TaxID=754477 RepID=I1YI59_METFJ|nr:flagellar biosynthesis anti-sigma factor FlgM [Methylophaga frappieri]AFJ02602.1 flagellar biosynthesis anti-sigma factor FlgM [Methylophaga frappieri]